VQRPIFVLFLALAVAGGAVSCRMRNIPVYPASSKAYVYPKLEVASLSGYVRIEGHKEMLRDVRIEARLLGGEGPLATSKTNSSGQFRLNLPKGEYLLRFTLKGFDTVVLPVVYTGAGAPSMAIALPPST
jgi:hypothetical protein